MSITPKIQAVVAAGVDFDVDLRSSVAAETGIMTVRVGGEERPWAKQRGGSKKKAHPVFVDGPRSQSVCDWGTGEDKGNQLVVTVKTTDAKNDEKTIS